MNNKIVKNGLLILLLIFGIVFIKQNSIVSTKLSDKYLNDQDLLDKSEYIVEATVIGKDTIINYSGVEFITFSLNIKDQLRGELTEENIKVLQTVVPNNSTFKLLERGKLYFIFLDKYVGPVTENAYVICGVDLGKIELYNESVILNDRQKDNFKVLNINNKNEFKEKVK